MDDCHTTTVSTTFMKYKHFKPYSTLENFDLQVDLAVYKSLILTEMSIRDYNGINWHVAQSLR